MHRYVLFFALAAAAMVAQPWGEDGALESPGVTGAALAPDAATASADPSDLPPLPPGVAELRFSDFFEPIGRRGLELTQRLRALDRKRVRILGYMVRQCEAPPGLFLLSPLPVTLHTHEYGLADDLPPTALHVQMPEVHAGNPVPYTPGLLLLTGILCVGPREETDGRLSCLHLELDSPGAGMMPAPDAKPAASPLSASRRQGCCANEEHVGNEARSEGVRNETGK